MALAGSAMEVRAFRLGDEPELHAVFYSSVREIAAKDYTAEQVAVWAPANPDMERWSKRMRELRPFVVEESGRLVGFADLQEDGCIDHFYVCGRCTKRGIGRLLMERIHSEAKKLGLRSLYANVSQTARPFFEHFGFEVVEERSVSMGKVSLRNWRMEKRTKVGDGS